MQEKEVKLNNAMPELTTSERNETALAVMGEKISNIQKNSDEQKQSMRELKEDVKALGKKIDDTYATKADLMETQKDVDSLKNNISWAVKIVQGLVITGI